MTFDDIEQVLGTPVVRDLSKAVEAAFVASLTATGTTRPVEEILIALLAAVVVRPTTYAEAHDRVAEIARRLEDVATATQKLYASGSGGNGGALN